MNDGKCSIKADCDGSISTVCGDGNKCYVCPEGLGVGYGGKGHLASYTCGPKCKSESDKSCPEGSCARPTSSASRVTSASRRDASSGEERIAGAISSSRVRCAGQAKRASKQLADLVGHRPRAAPPSRARR